MEWMNISEEDTIMCEAEKITSATADIESSDMDVDVGADSAGAGYVGSPFPVSFSAGSANRSLLGVPPTTSYPNLVDANMPNIPNYAGSISGSFSGLGGMIPGLVPGPSESAILSDIEGTLGKICQKFLIGRCFKTDCNHYHPSYKLLISTIANSSRNAPMTQVPMAPSSAVQAILAAQSAQGLQAHAAQQAQSQSSEDSTGPSEKDKVAMLDRTIQVSNLVPHITADQLKRLFCAWGTVVGCFITDSKDLAYIEYSKAEQAAMALMTDEFILGDNSLNVKMAESLPSTPVIPISIAAGMEPSFLMRGTPFHLANFLTNRAGEHSALVRNDNGVVDANDVMNGKVVMLCFFCLPLSDDAFAIARAVSLVSSEMHAIGAFELVIFVDCISDCDQDAALSKFVSTFPKFCLTPKSTHRLGDAMPAACYPHGLLVNRAKTVEWHKPLDFLFKYGVDAFPFTSEWLAWIFQREEAAISCKSWCSLYNFLCSMPLTFPSYTTSLSKNPGGGPEEVTVYDLQDKCVGLYLCQTGNLIPTLDDVHKKCCDSDQELEIILVYMPPTNVDHQLFQDNINSMLKDRNISWWVFPFINWVSRRLSRLFHQNADDRLIIVGPKSEYVELHGEAVILHHGASAYPFSSQLLVNREVDRLREVTLESLLSYGLDYVLWSDSAAGMQELSIGLLQGKTVIVYLHCAEDQSRDCFDKLVSHCKMTEDDMVFVSLNTSSTPDVGNSCEMPWFVFPWESAHSNYVTRAIFGKGDKCSTIIVFGKDGCISSIRALRLVCTSCSDFPLGNNLHNEMSVELTGSEVVHAVPSNLRRHSNESLNHVKALFPLLGEEYFFPGLPVRGRMKPTEEMHNFYDCVDEVDIFVIEENAEYPKAIYERITNIDTSNFDVISFLSAEKRPYLIRNDGCKTPFEVERLRDKKWVMICCLTCPIYFHSRMSLVYRGVSDICSELYDEYGDTFEMVLVLKMSRDFEADESSFRHLLSGFPPSCLVVPFKDSDSRDFICCSLGFSRFPLGLYLRADERKVIWHNSLRDMERYGVDTFPFKKEDFLKKFHEEQQNPLNIQSLEQLFDCSSTENPGGANYYEKMSMKHLDKKVVGVYLCLCGESIPMLEELHKVCKANNIEFEIVVVCCLYTVKNSNPVVFRDQIINALEKRKISWWVLPYKGSLSRKLVRLLRSPTEEKLIIAGNGVVDLDGAYFIRELGKSHSRKKPVSSSSDDSGLLGVISEFMTRYRIWI